MNAIISRWCTCVLETVVEQNGPEFAFQEFAEFSYTYGFDMTSSPWYPQANGMAESAVKIAKSILRHEDLVLLS